MLANTFRVSSIMPFYSRLHSIFHVVSLLLFIVRVLHDVLGIVDVVGGLNQLQFLVEVPTLCVLVQNQLFVDV